MNLVGPRPITVAELARYGRVRWHYLSVRPGITGLWQVSGRNNTTYEQRVALDRRYVEQRSLWLDLGILLRTMRVVAVREGAR
jgi:lipopolysaccharide/colanic/teichoic acid biosynthesis glycosyltransferase